MPLPVSSIGGDQDTMNIRSTVQASLALLSRRDRRILFIISVVQMSTAILDLFGILLIGVVAALSVSVISQGPLPSPIETGIATFGLADWNVGSLALLLAAAAGIALIGKSLINLLLTRRILRFLANRQAVVSGRLVTGLLSQPLLQLQAKSSQEIAYALTAGTGLATLVILGQAVVAISELALLVVLTVALVAISPIVAVFAVAFFLIVAFILQKVLSGWAGRIGRRVAHVDVASYASILEALRTYREAVVSDRRALYAKRFQDLRWEGAVVQSDLQFMNLIPKYVFEVALIIGAALLAISQFMTRDLDAAIGVIVVFLAAGSRVVPSMLRLQGAAITIKTASGQAAPTYRLAEELKLSQEGFNATPALGSVDSNEIRLKLSRGHTDFTPWVSVSGVTLSYPGSNAFAVSEATFTLPAGGSLALVGSTGAGKSTLADIILGVITPDAGTVLIGGVTPIEAISRWPGSVAYVPQDVAMTDGTVRANVALGLPREAVDDDWVWDALERAHLADFLRNSREGLDTLIGERGVNFSGGQRQRLGIARALFTKPRLIVFDEATSALDAETESLIADTFRQMEGSVTTVTIAHRLATVRHCDLVIFLDEGSVVAQGSFEDVRNLAPKFDEQAKLLGL